jgi:hypothetical protein
MEPFNGANKMVGQWMRVEHYRLHCAEGWPDSPYKKAVLAAIRSTMENLKTASPALIESKQCMVCAPWHKRGQIGGANVPLGTTRLSPPITRLAAVNLIAFSCSAGCRGSALTRIQSAWTARSKLKTRHLDTFNLPSGTMGVVAPFRLDQLTVRIGKRGG